MSSIERHFKDILGDKIESVVEDGKYYKIYLKPFEEFNFRHIEEFNQRDIEVIGLFPRCASKLEPQLLVLTMIRPSILCSHDGSA